MPDWRDEQLRYLVHFDDGGAGMRYKPEPLQPGVELREGDRRYCVERVEQPRSPSGLGHAWARRIERA